MLHIKFNACMDEIRNGNNSALEDIYTEYYKKIILTALSIVNNREDAKDIASDFIKYILEKPEDIPYVKSPSAYIYQSVRNRAVSYIRKNSRTVSISDCDEEIFVKTSNDDLYFLLTESLMVLSKEERELLLLHFVYGFKYREMSLILKKPVGTIKSQIHYLKDKLPYLEEF